MVVTALVTTAAATTYATIEANNRAREQRKQQERALEQQRIANQQAKETAEAEAQRADIAYNQANQQQPEVQAIVSRSEEDAIKKFQDEFAAEYKLDGERAQIHKKGNEIIIFSRSLFTISSSTNLPSFI